MKDISKFIDEVLNEVSGKYAYDWVSKISQYNRVVGSHDFNAIIEKVMKELETFGLDEIKLHKYPADGKTKTWDWTVTQSWEIKSGELSIIEPKNEITELVGSIISPVRGSILRTLSYLLATLGRPNKLAIAISN